MYSIQDEEQRTRLLNTATKEYENASVSIHMCS